MKHACIKAAFFCLALVLAGSIIPQLTKRLHAEDAVPVYQSSGDVATAFMNLLTDLSERDGSRFSYYGSQSDTEIWGMLSSKSLELVEANSANGIIKDLLVNLKKPEWQANGEVSANGKTATVKVTPNPAPVREVVCVREGGSWRVDLMATAALWLKLNPKDVEKILDRAMENGRRASCQGNLKQIGLGFAMYVQDYDEKYPPAKQWHDVMMPYVKNEQIFNCPSVPSGKNGYAMNWKLSKKNQSSVDHPSMMATLYESTTLKTNHSGDGRDMAFRHLNGTNIAFVDGRVKWFKQRDDNDKWLLSMFKFHVDPES